MKFKPKESKEAPQRTKISKDKIICHECGKPGHIRYNCPQNPKRKEKDNEKRRFNNPKTKKAYIVWDEPECDTTTSSSDEDESANLCLMGKHDAEASSSKNELEIPSSSEVSSNFTNDLDSLADSNMSISYEMLYDAYLEMNKEFEKLAKVAIERKNLILKFQQQVLNMQKEIQELKLENETLDLIYANASCNCGGSSSTNSFCGKCHDFEVEINFLKMKLENFTKGRRNLNNLIHNQRDHSNKTGLGYVKSKTKRTFKKKQFKKFGNFSKVDFSIKPTCFYCGMHGHTNNICRIKRFGVPSKRYVWVVKGKDTLTNKKGPNIVWVPESAK